MTEWLTLSSLMEQKIMSLKLEVKHTKACEVKVAQPCLTLCNPVDFTVCGILQARILEWVAIPFSRGSLQPRNQSGISCIAGRFLTS